MPPPLPTESTNAPPPPPPPNRIPLSLDDLIKKKQQEEEAKSKVRTPFLLCKVLLTRVQPKFLSKEERERIAIEKRAKEVEARQAAEAVKVNAVRESYRHTTPNGSSVDKRDGHIPTGPRAAQNGNSRHHHDDRRNNGHHPYERNSSDHGDNTSSSSRRVDRRPPVEAIEDKKRPMDPPSATPHDKETAAYRARYMGLAAPKTKKRRTNDKKFIFDWDEDADTSSNRVSEKAIDVAFGRGHFGGFDHASNSRGGLDRHWTEKKLTEMTERDWRIFREDFSISTKGLPPHIDFANL